MLEEHRVASGLGKLRGWEPPLTWSGPAKPQRDSAGHLKPGLLVFAAAVDNLLAAIEAISGDVVTTVCFA